MAGVRPSHTYADMKRLALLLAAVLTFTLANAPAAVASVTLYHHAYQVVYVEDHTGAAWPVTTLAASWDYGTDLSVRYGPCRTGAGCVKVYECWCGTAQPPGWVNWGYYVGTHVFAEPVTVHLNDSWWWPWRNRVQAVCHELGHALGIISHLGTYSCMYGYLTTAASAWPGLYARSLLNTVY